jgi:hypothetical protein
MIANPGESVAAIHAKRSGRPVDAIVETSRFVQDLGLEGDDAIDAPLAIATTTGMTIHEFNSSLYFSGEPTLAIFLRWLAPWREVMPAMQLPLTVGQIITAVNNGVLTSIGVAE